MSISVFTPFVSNNPTDCRRSSRQYSQIRLKSFANKIYLHPNRLFTDSTASTRFYAVMPQIPLHKFRHFSYTLILKKSNCRAKISMQ